MPRRWLIGVVAALAVILLAGRFATAAYADYLWYSSLGAGALWQLQFSNGAIITAGSILLATVFLFLNLYVVRQSVVSLILPRRIANLEIGEEVPGRYLTQLAMALAVVFGFLLALSRDHWMQLAAARHAVPFGEGDPVFEYELSYYVNWIPFETALFNWCLILLLVTLAVVLFLYALTPSLRWEKGEGLHATLYVRRHAGILMGLCLLILAWNFRLQMLDTLLNGSGVDGAFMSVDRQMLSTRTMLTVVTMLAAFLLAWALWTDQLRLALFCVSCVILVALGTNVVAPALLRGAVADADSIPTERPYAGIRAGRTRRAFAVDEMLPAEPTTTFSFTSLRDVVQGTPVWDPDAFEAAAAQVARATSTSGNAAYVCHPAGQLITAAVPRAEPIAGFHPPAWQLVKVLSGSTQTDGSPVPGADDEGITLMHPALVTEPAPAYLLVADSLDRIPAPSLNTTFSRLAHAWSRQDFRLLAAVPPFPTTRIVQHVSVKDRLRKIAPFFEQDSRIYPVIHADTLHWIVRLYSHSSSYPLSHELQIGEKRHRYFHHAATAAVNSATGRVRLYADDTPDPLARLWIRLLPSLFSAMKEMPAQMAAALPPPIDGAQAQADAFARYGGAQSGGALASSFPPDATSSRSAGALLSIPALCPGSAWIQPVLDANDRLQSLIIATGGADPRTYHMELATGRESWREILNRFAAVEDSIQMGEEPRVYGGPIRAVPVGGQVILIRTTYNVPPNGIPSVAAVSIMRGDSLYTAESLAQAAGVSGETSPDAALSPQQFRSRVDSLYQAMRAAMRRGDLITFAELFNSLGALLRAGGR